MAPSTSETCLWHSLPNEMKLAVVDNLSPSDVQSLSRVDMRSYEICIPASFRVIKLKSFDHLERFLDCVPRRYCRYIEDLDLCTESTSLDQVPHQTPRAKTDAVISLLIASPRLERLCLKVAGSLDKSVITPFAYLPELRRLSISNGSPEEQCPLSERLVVSIAATVPRLEELSLDRITRSRLHAPELEGVYPYVPLVFGDDDIPMHPVLGSELSLPSLLRVPSLRKLIIRDTHLGDARWATTPVLCRLQVLDLGSCYHESEDANRVCTERIMAAVGRTIDEFSLTTAVSDAQFAKPSATPLPRLRKLHISPFFPVDSVVDTMSNLAGSPIESLSMQCYEDDVVDVCSALEQFLSLRVERGSEFYDKLTRIDVAVAASEDAAPYDQEEHQERIAATNHLQEFCRDLSLASVVEKAPPVLTTLGVPRSMSICNDEKAAVATNGRINLLA